MSDNTPLPEDEAPRTDWYSGMTEKHYDAALARAVSTAVAEAAERRKELQAEIQRLQDRIARAGIAERRAVAEAVQRERERCARLCDDAVRRNIETTARLRWPLEALAKAIRATPDQPEPLPKE